MEMESNSAHEAHTRHDGALHLSRKICELLSHCCA